MRQLLTTILLAITTTVSAQSWIDLTDTYIKNPSYVGNSYSYWEGTALGSASPKENAEHYSKTYDTYQTITGLKAGKYRLSLNAFYRMGEASNDYSLYSGGKYSSYQYAQLYGTSSLGDYYTPIAVASSGKVSTSLGGSASGVGNVTGGNWWNQTYQYYIPNNMEAAYYWFQAGYYKNTVECQVGSDGILKIGIRKSNTIDSDWTCLDNWKLEYWGTVVKATSITISQTTAKMVPTQKLSLSATVIPADATYSKVKWQSSNTSVATVDADGNVKALQTGSATIIALAADGSGVSAICSVTVEEPAEATADNIIINELMASNIDVYRDPSTCFGTWAELYNPSDKGVKIGGLYITDDATNLKKYRLHDDYGALGAHGYSLLNFDHYDNFTEASYRQIDTKLDADGGTLIISDGTSVIAQVDYPKAVSRASYARTTDGGSEWSMTSMPTPGASNATSEFATKQLEAPVVDTDAQLFTGSISFNVTIPAGATLRYTTDGSTPTLTNGKISENGAFIVSESTPYRFRLFQSGKLASPVTTRTFIQNSGNEPFPVMSIVTDKNNLFESEYGIYQYSDHGRTGNGQTTKYNGNMDWDRPVNFEYITPGNECVVSQECDFSPCGGWSRAWEPHSFKLKACKQYEQKNSFDYQFFGTVDENPAVDNGKSNLKHKVLQIRNGGNDGTCRIMDAAMQQIVASSGFNVEHQAWQPVHVFVNAQPYAVLNMREPNNKHYGYANYGIDTDLMDQFEICPDSGYVQKAGTRESFDRWYNLAKTASNADSYEQIKKLVNIDEYINYMATEFYAGTWDWPQNNVKGFRDQSDGKFRFVMFDFDSSLSTTTPFTDFFDKQNYTFDELHGYDYSTSKSIEGTHLTKENEFVTIFKNMLQNDTFRKQFIDAFCIVAGAVFEPTRVKNIVSGLSSYLSEGNYVSSSGTANNIISNMTSSRQTSMISQLQNCSNMQLSGKTAQNVTISCENGSYREQILINGQEVPTGKFSGKLFSPITVKAVSPAGYRFIGWMNNGATTAGKDVFGTASSWKFYDGESVDGDWKSASYSDNSWSEGNAPLGYGKTQTTQTQKNHSSYYFRKTFNLSDCTNTDTYTLNYTVDDGMVVYVNGQEAGRYQMPSGTVDYNTAASTYANGNPDTGTMTLPASLFHSGSNVIAVEVHNNQPSSSDIYWDASLVRSETLPESCVSTDAEYTIPSSGSVNITAKWEYIDQLEKCCNVPVKINEVSANNSMYINDLLKKDDWVELYNTTNYQIDVNGLYLSDNASKPQKYQITAPEGANIIEPNGHLIVWCSKRTGSEKAIHASFKLGNDDGSMVILSSSDEFVANNQGLFDNFPTLKEFSDTIHYNAMAYDQTIGRYPDGGNSYYLFNHPTINYANSLQVSDTYVGTDVTSESSTGITELAAKESTNTNSLLSVTYYTVSGVYVGKDRSKLPSGIYIEKSGAGARKISR